ncbi:MAG: hypothetical protein J6A21_08625 [Lentisphaeria bacterium]|nr:hypothetical protein [Lentisphaeria bacterium]
MVPVQNRQKYDCEIADHFSAVSSAWKKGDEKVVERILKRWERRKIFLSCERSCFLAPPSLVPLPGESRTAYLERCYSKWK